LVAVIVLTAKTVSNETGSDLGHCNRSLASRTDTKEGS